MEPENIYIRSSDMDEQESEPTQESNSPWGGWEWLKTLLFLGILFVAGFITIRVAGPMLFSDYVPGIIGLDNQENSDSVELVNPIESDSSTGDTDESAETPREETIDQSDGTNEAEASDSETTAEEAPATSDGVEEGETAGKAEEDPAETEDAEATQQSEVEVYIVKIGDTLTSIAAIHGTTVDEIIAVNQFLNPNYVQLGQEINIPK